MARPLRITFPGAFYHVTSRGNEKKPVYKNKRDREKFLEYLESATERYNAVIHAFCLMDNHYHLLLETPSGNLPQIMRHINGAYTTYFNTKRGRSGHLFQGRYKAILVEKDEYGKELSRYIHLNPVRAKIVKAPDAYEWSSYNFFIGKKKAPKWLHMDFLLNYFGKNISATKRGYKEFVSSLLNKKYESPLKEITGSVMLARQEFIDFVKDNYLSGLKPSRDLPAIRHFIKRISMDELITAVDTEFGETPTLARNLKVYLCRKHTGEKIKTIGEQFGIGDAAVSQSCKRFKLKVEDDRKLKRKIDQFEKKFVV